MIFFLQVVTNANIYFPKYALFLSYDVILEDVSSTQALL